jgi:hypothetical protein
MCICVMNESSLYKGCLEPIVMVPNINPGMSLFTRLFNILMVAAWQTLSLVTTALYRGYTEVFQLKERE